MLAGARRVRWPKQRLDERRAFVLISVWLQHEVKRLRVAIARHAAVAYHAHYETVNAPLVAAHEGHAGALIADGHAGKQDEKKNWISRTQSCVPSQTRICEPSVLSGGQ
jgi:hypothetical protein